MPSPQPPEPPGAPGGNPTPREGWLWAVQAWWGGLDPKLRRGFVGVGALVAVFAGTYAVTRLSQPGPGAPDEPGAPGSGPRAVEAGAGAPTGGTSGVGPAVGQMGDADEEGSLEGIAALIVSDPEAAAGRLAATRDLGLLDRWLPELMAHWTNTHPRGAAAWVDRLPQGSFRDDAQQDLLNEWAQKDPQAAARWMAGRIEADGSADALGHLLNVWAFTAPEDAAAWLSELPADKLPPSAFGAMAGAWASTDPAAASRWVESVEDPVKRSHAAVNLVLLWAESQPAAAARWLETSPAVDDRGRENAMLGVLAAWSDIDPSAAASWINAAPESANKEKGKSIFAETVAAVRPADAVRWARSVIDETARAETVASVYGTWLDDDPQAAKVHLLETLNSLPPESPEESALLEVLFEYDPEFKASALRSAMER